MCGVHFWGVDMVKLRCLFSQYCHGMAWHVSVHILIAWNRIAAKWMLYQIWFKMENCFLFLTFFFISGELLSFMFLIEKKLFHLYHWITCIMFIYLNMSIKANEQMKLEYLWISWSLQWLLIHWLLMHQESGIKNNLFKEIYSTCNKVQWQW